MTYDLRSIELPRLGGRAVRAFAAAVESRVTGGPIRARLLRDLGIDRLSRLEIDEPPTFLPIHPANGDAKGAAASPLARERSRGDGRGFAFVGAHDYARAYRAGSATPLEVAERLLDAVAESDRVEPPLGAIVRSDRDDVLAQARASTERFRAGRPLGLLDGVPVATKDEVDQTPYPTTVGTRFLGRSPALRDSTVVARMRATGALLFGKTNMHELGLGVTGLNIHHGTPRNPYAPTHHTGGSSSGSAAAVAAGLCPIAIGADAGGSIRIPAAFCGLVGLKPTFGRVSEFGAAPLCWSVAHLGALAATATDAALAYAVLAGPDPLDPNSLHQPLPRYDHLERADLSGLALGVYRPWFRHATGPLVSACEALIEHFREAGADVREVVIPELDLARIGHVVTIAAEFAAAMQLYERDRGELSAEIRTNLALGRGFTASEYVQAQRMRTRVIAHFDRALRDVDVILTPATGVSAPPIRPGALEHGESDLSTLIEIIRFSAAPNFTGHPAIAFPTGYDAAGLPLGMQAIGRPWCEDVLLRLALVAERAVERRRPVMFWDVLGGH